MTHTVKVRGGRPRIENAKRVHYNLQVTNARISGHLLFALLCAPLLMGGACEKKKPNDTGAISAMDRANPAVAAGPTDTTPLDGIDVSKLEGDRASVFYQLVGSLTSPCGKSHSLRTSYTQDTACKRAPYAVKYVLAMLQDEVPEADVRQFYAAKYEKTPEKVKLDVSGAPRVGNDDAPVRLVEFFDYQCSHCIAFAPMLEQVAETHKGKVVEYFMMLPILEAKSPGSRSAAQAALAAHQQGKFKEMHKKLLTNSAGLSKEAVLMYAKELGLDLTKFAADYEAATAQIAKDEAQAAAADVHSTPTLFFNDRKYEGPMHSDYIGMWVDEELAVNR